MTQPRPSHNFVLQRPVGDTHERQVCDTCGFVNYQNPKIIVGSVVHHAGRILMCRRAIAPRVGYWTIPAGYLELDETVAAGAQREAREEACAEITIDRVLAVYSLPHIGQVQIIHLATLDSPNFGPGDESIEVELFDWHQIPWEELAFPSVEWALRHADVAADEARKLPFTSPPGTAL